MSDTPRTDNRAWGYSDLCRELERENAALREALTDISMCRIPNVPNGVTVSMEQFGVFARNRATDALGSVESSAGGDSAGMLALLEISERLNNESRGENDVEGRAPLAPEAQAAPATHREQDGAATVVTGRRDGHSDPTPQELQDFFERVWDTDEFDPVLNLTKDTLRRLYIAAHAVECHRACGVQGGCDSPASCGAAGECLTPHREGGAS